MVANKLCYILYIYMYVNSVTNARRLSQLAMTSHRHTLRNIHHFFFGMIGLGTFQVVYRPVLDLLVPPVHLLHPSPPSPFPSGSQGRGHSGRWRS